MANNCNENQALITRHDIDTLTQSWRWSTINFQS